MTRITNDSDGRFKSSVVIHSHFLPEPAFRYHSSSCVNLPRSWKMATKGTGGWKSHFPLSSVLWHLAGYLPSSPLELLAKSSCKVSQPASELPSELSNTEEFISCFLFYPLNTSQDEPSPASWNRASPHCDLGSINCQHWRESVTFTLWGGGESLSLHLSSEGVQWHHWPWLIRSLRCSFYSYEPCRGDWRKEGLGSKGEFSTMEYVYSFRVLNSTVEV